MARDHTRLGGDTSRTMRAIEDLTEARIEVWYYIENERVIQLETPRLEKEILSSLSELRTVFASQPADGRKILESLLDGKLVLAPVETWRGKRYKVEGKANLGGMIQLPATLFAASPGDWNL